MDVVANTVMILDAEMDDMICSIFGKYGHWLKQCTEKKAEGFTGREGD